MPCTYITVKINVDLDTEIDPHLSRGPRSLLSGPIGPHAIASVRESLFSPVEKPDSMPV